GVPRAVVAERRIVDRARHRGEGAQPEPGGAAPPRPRRPVHGAGRHDLPGWRAAGRLTSVRRICGCIVSSMTQMRVREAAMFLGVSEDTIRRRIERGALTAHTDAAGRKVLEGIEVARLARELAVTPELPGATSTSARNRFVG